MMKTNCVDGAPQQGVVREAVLNPIRIVEN